jgi:hypothetical protein
VSQRAASVSNSAIIPQGKPVKLIDFTGIMALKHEISRYTRLENINIKSRPRQLGRVSRNIDWEVSAQAARKGSYNLRYSK